MTEQEREEIVRQMAVAIRKQKFARTGRIGCFDETNITDDELSEARAALAVAEPVIREQCAKAPFVREGKISDEMDNAEWLRKSSQEEWCGSALNKCADEITRLREENARLRSILATKVRPPFDYDLAGEPYAAKDRQPEPGGLGRVGQVEGGGEDSGA